MEGINDTMPWIMSFLKKAGITQFEKASLITTYIRLTRLLGITGVDYLLGHAEGVMSLEHGAAFMQALEDSP